MQTTQFQRMNPGVELVPYTEQYADSLKMYQMVTKKETKSQTQLLEVPKALEAAKQQTALTSIQVSKRLTVKVGKKYS